MSEKKTRLRKVMRPIDVWGLALGAIIGWGCFVLPGTVFLPKAGPAGTAIGLFIGAFLIIVIAISYGYLIRTYPISGGEFIYTKETIGRRNAFVCGWAMIEGNEDGQFGFQYIGPGVADEVRHILKRLKQIK